MGDPQQLPATVLSARARELALERSLFERLQAAGCPCRMLSVQYRMQPPIREFPSRHFYAGRLVDGDSVLAAPQPPFYAHPLLKPYVVFDVASGREQRHRGGGSLRNQVPCQTSVLHHPNPATAFALSAPSDRYTSAIYKVTAGFQQSVPLCRYACGHACCCDAGMCVCWDLLMVVMQGRSASILLGSNLAAARFWELCGVVVVATAATNLTITPPNLTAGGGGPGSGAVLGAAGGDGGGGARGAARGAGAGARGGGRHHALPPAGALPARHVRARCRAGGRCRGDAPLLPLTSLGALLRGRVGVSSRPTASRRSACATHSRAWWGRRPLQRWRPSAATDKLWSTAQG